MISFSISLRDIALFGNGLNRPECVLCTAKGMSIVPIGGAGSLGSTREHTPTV